MKVIIAGTRHITDRARVFTHIESWPMVRNITEVVCGMNGEKNSHGRVIRGVDLFGKEWAELKGIPVKEFPPDWDKFGKSAGPRRNAEMAEYADALIVLTTGESRGSFNMIDQMEKLKKHVYWDMKR